MKQGTLNSSIDKTICLLLFLSCALALRGQSAGSNRDNKDVDKVYFPLYNGLSVSTDIYGLGAHLRGSDNLYGEIAIEANLKNRFFPIIEMGYGKADAYSERGIHYKTAAPYFRLGMNYNTMYKKGKPSYLYVGLRYGFTSFSYDVGTIPAQDPIFGGSMLNPSLIDNIWGGNVPFNHKGLKASMGWIELLAGVRANIFKDFSMGWSLRYKRRMNNSLNEHGNPGYVPGFGEFDSNRFDITYSLYYKLPW